MVQHCCTHTPSSPLQLLPGNDSTPALAQPFQIARSENVRQTIVKASGVMTAPRGPGSLGTSMFSSRVQTSFLMVSEGWMYE